MIVYIYNILFTAYSLVLVFIKNINNYNFTAKLVKTCANF